MAVRVDFNDNVTFILTLHESADRERFVRTLTRFYSESYVTLGFI